MSNPRETKAERESAFREMFLASLNRRLAGPSDTWPTVRCWTKTSFGELAREIRNELAQQTKVPRLSLSSLEDWLVRIKLAYRLNAEGQSFLVFGNEAAVSALPQPLELLLAACPQGVICYFSALSYFSLTTQPVTHHHIAELQPDRAADERPSASASDPTKIATDSPTETSSPTTVRLGTVLFRHEGLPYYVTRRSTRLTPGIQHRALGPKTTLPITTVEQTLLDTVRKPFHCGGPEVIFEAWEQAHEADRFDEGRMAECLRAMNYLATTRRTAAFLELVGRKPGPVLQRVLDQALVGLDRTSEHAVISLLPGVPYERVHPMWLVRMP